MEVSIASDSERSKSADKTEDEMFQECDETVELEAQTDNEIAKHHNQRWSSKHKGSPGAKKSP
eukprot:2293549-Karenia_brevis.AAC.1